MFIHNLENTVEEVNPNVVSGADYDKRLYSNYGGDQEELLRLHNSIVKAKGEAEQGKKELAIANKELKDLAPFLSTHSKEWGRLIALRNRGVIQDDMELRELDKKIAKEREQKDYYRMKYSQLTTKISKLDTYINSREQGSIFGMKQQFEEISGKPYTGNFQPVVDEPEIINPVVENTENDTEIRNDMFIGMPPPDVPKTNFVQNSVKTIQEKTGLSKNQTYVALGVIGVLVISKILK
tara:strand:+ start:375 stop:1088 length:714 start_codon:yes stop_codon:yes gene_type:complete